MSQTCPSKRKDRKCLNCPTMVRRDSKSGMCAPCVKKSAGFRQAASQGTKKRYEDPQQRARTGAGVRKAYQADPTLKARKSAEMKAVAADPAWKARNAELCRERRLWEKGVAGRTPESDAQAGRTFSRLHGIGSWCPPDYVEMARQLRKQNVPVEEVKRMVEAQEQVDLQRLRRKMGRS